MMRRAACAAAPAGFELDAWLPEPRVLTLHRRDARADPDSLWRAAQTVRLSDTPRLGRIIRWRIEGTPPHLPFAELFRAYPFTLLAEGDRWSVSGLCGRIWTLARDYPRISGPEEFAAWREPGTVRVAFAHGVENDADGRSALVSEARVKPVDRRADLRLRAVWAAVGRFERLIGAEALRVATRRAELLAAAPTASPASTRSEPSNGPLS